MKKIIGLFVAAALFVLAGCTEPNTLTSSTTGSNEQKIVGEQVEVVSIMDGDTMKVKYDGKVSSVRFLLIDAPEMYHKQLGEQPFGKEAQKRNRDLINNAEVVSLEFDKTGDKEDKYGRLLAYVYVDGKSVQEQLIKEGLVRVGYVYNKQAAHLDDYYKAQDEAKAANRGIWQYPGYVTNRGFVKSKVPGWSAGQNPDKNGSLEKSVSTNEATQTQSKTTSSTNNSSTKSDEACTIKGNINAKGNKNYFLPGTNNYDNVQEEKMFCSEEEAQKAGFKKGS